MRYLIINGAPVDGWIVLTKQIDAPAVKTISVSVEGADGEIDLSTVLTEGNPVYGNRPLKFDIAVLITPALTNSGGFLAYQSAMNGAYHGRTVDITTDDAPELYFTGRCALTGWAEEPGVYRFSVEVDADPYRYEQADTEVSASAAAVPGTEVTLTNLRKWVSPTVTVTGGSLQMVVGSTTYGLQEGAQTIPGFILRDGDTQVRLVGDPGVSATFTWRRGVL